jgi:uncharacterized beta-barrel protein YwiB (DUF1934 family)
LKEALIRLKGKTEGSTADLIDFTSIGKVEIKNDTIYIEYDESELSGMENTVSTIIISGDAITLNRTGEWTSTMAFVEGEEMPADIITSYGIMRLKVYTDKIDVSVSDRHIAFDLRYAYSIGADRISNHLRCSCEILGN